MRYFTCLSADDLIILMKNNAMYNKVKVDFLNKEGKRAALVGLPLATAGQPSSATPSSGTHSRNAFEKTKCTYAKFKISNYIRTLQKKFLL
mgnify:CR=1 FL=1